MARRLHMDVQVKVVHWDEKERALHAGVIDCIADGFTHTADHARRFALTQPYVRDVRVFAVLRQAPYATVADLHGKRLGVHAVTDVEENDAYHALFGQVKTYAHYVQALTALSRAEVDVVALNLVTLCAVTPHLRRLYRILDEPIDTCEYVFAFRADARALRDMVVRTLSQLQREGFVSALSKRWFGSDMSIIDR
ncbi:transporter substrate-binding domain-containing protein [Treponema paraluiscuniculi]|uniref:amino acid ABC transporter substrate-binding protein n=1 Tax=Treponema paraluiscuniculi TaxID=53435 RepID=UPI0002F76743|nr:transporter substrate-binding domain-containing protein [Treponema paraluiscuniculi]